MKPIIGVLAEIDDELNTRVQNPYIHAIEKSGGIPVLFPYVGESETIEHLVDICDGFFFTGGADIDPRRYGEEARESIGEIQTHRDEFEFHVFQRVIKTSKPILAICRGAQLVNVALGGTLYQDIPSEVETNISHRQSEPKFSPSHDVRILVDTPLYEMMRTEQIKANSFHHQAIKTLGKGLAIMAVANDGIVEAVYSLGKQYVCAYQWHPERLFETDKQNRIIFEEFIHHCKS
ncbi:MAG: gamma-glutamyl-gamma-aminobutyrate hydrolase family protein [Clostridia bacterium]|nr:gamma-glutamyl-gamma-aminobutyrate hydrolase family protein [Clostridia bacterium]